MENIYSLYSANSLIVEKNFHYVLYAWKDSKHRATVASYEKAFVSTSGKNNYEKLTYKDKYTPF